MRAVALLLGALVAARALAAEVVPAAHRALVPEAALETEGRALQRLGFQVSVVPAPWRFARREGLRTMLKGETGVVVVPSRDPSFLKALRAYATRARCRVVVRGEGGLALDQVASLDSIGPCFFEVHLATDPEPFARPLSRLRPASVVWEAGAIVPPLPVLARFARQPLPVLAVDDDAAVAALDALGLLADDRLALRIRAPRGVLSAATWRALRLPERTVRVTVVAQDGLDPFAARDLRGLARSDVELGLERSGSHPGLLDAAAALARPVDGPDQRRVRDEDADAPLLRPP